MYAEHAIGNEKYKVYRIFNLLKLEQISSGCCLLNCLLLLKFQNKKDKKATEKQDHMEKTIKKQARKVEKLQDSIEKQIYRHTEL